MIVADCGSTDATLKIADDAGATVIAAGCGQQLLAGAQAARKPWLLFLKPCSSMEQGWEDEARAFIAKGETGAAAFRFRLAGTGFGPGLRKPAAIRARAFRLPNCCNGLLIPAKLLDAVGACFGAPRGRGRPDAAAWPEPRFHAKAAVIANAERA